MKIISGGQTGADRAALDAARTLGFETGGWAPLGYRTDEGDDPSLAEYGLKQTQTRDYPTRTRLNVKSSDATVIFMKRRSAGCALTYRACQGYGKPCLILTPEGDPKRLLRFVVENRVKTLNVAGHRERTCPGIYASVYNIVINAFKGVAGAIDNPTSDDM